MTPPAAPQGPSPDHSNTTIRAYINAYAPTCLTDVQWVRLADEVRALTRLAEPVSTTDAKTFMSSLCAFLAWSEPKNGPQSVATALTEDHVRRHIADLQEHMSAGGRSNAWGRLQRALRLLAGVPARTKRQPRPASAPPYLDQELDVLVAPAEDVAALAEVLALLGRCLPGGGASPEAAPFMLPAEAEWAQARRAAAKAGVNLTLDRVRVTWAVRQLSTDLAVASLLPLIKTTRADLENAKDHLPEVGPERYRTYLRG